MKDIKLRKINILDFVLIIIVLATIIGAYIKINHRQLSMLTMPRQRAYLNVNIFAEKNGETNDLSLLSIGKELISNKDSIPLGKITNVKNIYEKIYSPDKDGNLQIYTTERVIGIKVRIKTYVKVNNYGSYVEGSVHVAPGKTLQFTDEKGNSFVGEILSMSVVE